jgi:transposase InsO family protein
MSETAWEGSVINALTPYYPQSNGKIEHWHGTLKQECIRPRVLLNLDDARQVVGRFVEHFNEVRLNSAIGYVAPADKLNGNDKHLRSDIQIVFLVL